MLIPSIDLMGGRIVQLVQGEKLKLAFDDFDYWIERFKKYPIIQLIDLDAALGRGSNDELVRELAARAITRVGGGVRSTQRAQTLVAQGAHRVIVGTAAFDANGIHREFLRTLVEAVGQERLIIALDSKADHIVTEGWQKATTFTAEEVIRSLEPYCSGFLCTYVDKAGNEP